MCRYYNDGRCRNILSINNLLNFVISDNHAMQLA
jgi:hypothetical protein